MRIRIEEAMPKIRDARLLWCPRGEEKMILR